MAIPETQLNIWSHQGSVTQSSNTYGTVRRALEDTSTPYAGKKFEIFLQGSYGNDTNIWSESDVDVVIELNSCWQSDLSQLSEQEKLAFGQSFANASYDYSQFKHDVLQALAYRFGTDVADGKKAIAISTNGSRRKADVLVAIQFRKYWQFRGAFEQRYTEGVCFYTRTGTRIVNYPRQHSANLTQKHQATGSWYKPMARILKNLRGRLVDEGLLGPGVAPSYYLEGLLYNVPNDKFGRSYANSFLNTFNWIINDADMDKLVCANERDYLLRDDQPTSWSKADAQAFLNAAINLWNQW